VCTEVPWASRTSAAHHSSQVAAHPKHADLPRVVCLRVSDRVALRYALAFDSGLLVVLTDGLLTMDTMHKGESVADAQW
jgi:hypothetical protein